MDKLEEILGKYDEFNTYLNEVNLGELGKQYGRKELETFIIKLYSLKTRSLAYEISKLTQVMKEKEFPELLGAHHFPAIRQMDFLSDEGKIALDKFLVRFRVGNYLGGFYSVIANDEKREKVLAFLQEYGIIEERFRAMCPICGDGQLSKALSRAERDIVDKTIADTTLDWETKDEIVSRYLSYCCRDCDTEVDLGSEKSFGYSHVYVMLQERDTSLDKT